MRNPLAARALDWAGTLRYPTLFKLAAALFLVDLVIPDPIPFLDELLFGLTTLLLANWKTRKAPLQAPVRRD
ncbi:hypothetical protein BRM22_22590 [Xanthomonas oryzae pv. oryzae]|uniref:Uncharacterized protein n=1 Tax=Xanthomonas oryzae pv. oryzae (strain KACC10331 / KXO85) TaxID=291331 RepID=Q5H2Q2_XANOR|nr:DUF6116 family protein [Xanthomonas oryzae]AAW74769.1 conserved hypothetical protein [Xanthomonas oryzae pv. oryzae KACC 10331]AJQ84056.1 membrane protein [Xanthomonas oryzae pv. oryzae PXO86]ALZ72738.1 hypothetical protein APZ20_15810 [Xanthomonas oryzae pv. oryzae]AOS01868.1 hypothetical protein ATY42_07200 [Xanthomonas oryzae pv. oryzae]AOS05299.1 hypothetical protein ATY43_03105 [Xanthomonas oryzae pv. oryzae]